MIKNIATYRLIDDTSENEEENYEVRQLKYCSRACSGKSRYNRSKMIVAEMVINIKKI